MEAESCLQSEDLGCIASLTKGEFGGYCPDTGAKPSWPKPLQ